MDVNKHTCPNCGGKLLVDTERQMYECPYCGVTFDYDYFREESVLDIAGESLKNNEFTSADRAYDFLLEKEPDNFEALRGKALIAMNVSKIEDISRPGLYSEINYDAACHEIDRAIEASDPDDREYFTVMKDIVDAGHEYVDEKAQIKAHNDSRNKYIHILSELIDERDTVCIYSSSRISLKKAVILTILCYIFCCLLIVLGYKYATRNPYSKAEDLSKYQTEQTDDSDRPDYYPYGYNDFTGTLDAISNYMEYEKALEREEQRKINYDNWEKTHDHSYKNLIGILIFATVIYLLIVLALFMWGRRLNAEIAQLQAQADGHADQIRDIENRMAELEGRIGQGYKRLCELRPVSVAGR